MSENSISKLLIYDLNITFANETIEGWGYRKKRIHSSEITMQHLWNSDCKMQRSNIRWFVILSYSLQTKRHHSKRTHTMTEKSTVY